MKRLQVLIAIVSVVAVAGTGIVPAGVLSEVAYAAEITETEEAPNLSEKGCSDFSRTASSLNLRKILFKIYCFSLVKHSTM